MELRPSEIFYSQDSILNKFGNYTCHGGTYIGETLDQLLTGYCNVNSIDHISVKQVNGKWFTGDNRRLWVFRKAEEIGFLDTIPVKITYYINENKFTSLNGGTSIRIRGGGPGGHKWINWRPPTRQKNDSLSQRSNIHATSTASHASTPVVSPINNFSRNLYNNREATMINVREYWTNETSRIFSQVDKHQGISVEPNLYYSQPSDRREYRANQSSRISSPATDKEYLVNQTSRIPSPATEEDIKTETNSNGEFRTSLTLSNNYGQQRFVSSIASTYSGQSRSSPQARKNTNDFSTFDIQRNDSPMYQEELFTSWTSNHKQNSDICKISGNFNMESSNLNGVNIQASEQNKPNLYSQQLKSSGTNVQDHTVSVASNSSKAISNSSHSRMKPKGCCTIL